MNVSVFDEQLAKFQASHHPDIDVGELLAHASALALKMIEGKIAAISEEDLMALNRLFWDAEKEERQAPMPGQYWQGKKDGLRAALALLDKKTGIDWEAFQESSRAGQASELEILRSLYKEAFNMLTLVYNGGKLYDADILTLLQRHDRVANRIKLND